MNHIGLRAFLACTFGLIFLASGSSVKEDKIGLLEHVPTAIQSIPDQISVIARYHCRFDESFLSENTGDSVRKAEGRTEHTKLLLSSSKIRLAVTTQYLDGSKRSERTFAFDGSNTFYSMPEGGVIAVSSGFRRNGIGDFNGLNSLLLPYSFLVQSSFEQALPNITLSEIKSFELWESYLSISEVNYDNLSNVYVLSRKSEEFRDTVRLKVEKESIIPVFFERSRSDGIVLFRYELIQIERVTFADKTIEIPKSAKITFYVSGHPITTYELNIDSIEKSSDVQDEAFSIDMVTAELIWDEQAKQYIEVPK